MRISKQPALELPQVLSRADMIAELKLIVGGRSLRYCAAQWGLDFREISAVIRGKQFPGDKLLAIMGLMEDSEVRYIRVTGVNR